MGRGGGKVASNDDQFGDRDHNWLIYNTGRSVSPNFNFMLRVEGLFDLPCKAVHSFKKANEYEYIQEGGLNDYVHMRRKPISKPFTFEVERYVGVDILDPLQPGTELVLPVVLMVWRRVMYKNFTPFRVYTFTGCTVMEKKYGELNAEKSGLLEETTTIGYREMMRMTMPAGVFDDFGDTFDISEYEDLSPEAGKALTSKFKNLHAFHPFDDDDRANPRLWQGIQIQRQEAVKAALEDAKKNGNTKLIAELSADPILKAVFTSKASARPDERSVKAEGRVWKGFDPKRRDKSTVSEEKPLKDGEVLSTVSAHPDKRSSAAKQRLWDGFNPDAKSPSDFTEDNPAPEGTAFSISSATPDNRSTNATGTRFDITEYDDLVPKTEEDKKKPKTDLFTTRSATPDNRSTNATGTRFDITEYDDLVPKTEEDKKKPKTDLFTTRSATHDDRSSAATGTEFNFSEIKGMVPPPDDSGWASAVKTFNYRKAAPDNKSKKVTGTRYDIVKNTGKSATPDKRSKKKTDGTVYDIKTDNTKKAKPDERSKKKTDGTVYDIKTDNTKKAKPDERSKKKTDGTVYDIKTDNTKKAKPDERSKKKTDGTVYDIKTNADKSSYQDDKSRDASGTVYDIKNDSGRSARQDNRSTMATQVLWPGVKKGETSPKTLRANVLRTLQ